MEFPAYVTNNWMSRLHSGFVMFDAAWALLRARRALLLLPVTAILGIMVFWVVLVPLVFALASALDADLGWLATALRIGMLLLGWFLSAFLVIFFNAALVVCARGDFTGQPTSLGAGIAAAARRWPQILAWSAFAATLGLVLRSTSATLRDGGNLLDWLFSAFIDSIHLAGTTAAYFVVPAMVLEGIGPSAALRRSFTIVRERWGEVLVLTGGLGIVVTMAVVPVVFVLVVTGMSIDGRGLPPTIDRAIATGVLYACVATIAFGVVVYHTFQSLLKAAAYCYATTGTSPAALRPGVLAGLFEQKTVPAPAARRAARSAPVSPAVPAAAGVAPVEPSAAVPAAPTDSVAVDETTDVPAPNATTSGSPASDPTPARARPEPRRSGVTPR